MLNHDEGRRANAPDMSLLQIECNRLHQLEQAQPISVKIPIWQLTARIAIPYESLSPISGEL
jgi:hypothetical protein